MSDDPYKYCTECPVSLLCLAGRLNVKARCATCDFMFTIHKVGPEPEDMQVNEVRCTAPQDDLGRNSVIPYQCKRCMLERPLASVPEMWKDV